MAKPTTGRVAREPAPTPSEAQLESLVMTSLYAGVSFLVGTVLLAAIGGAGLFLGSDLGPMGARVGLALGLAAGLGLGLYELRRNAARIRGRSPDLYRGAWLGLIGAAVVIAFMAFLPQVAFPRYCPPGAICESGQP